MSSGSDWSTRDPERFQRAHELLIMEQSKERVTKQLAASGLSDEDAEEPVQEAWEYGAQERETEILGDLKQGLPRLVFWVALYIVLYLAFNALDSPFRQICHITITLAYFLATLFPFQKKRS